QRIEIAPVADRRRRRPLEVPALERDLPAWREDAAADLLLFREAAADDRPQRAAAEAKEDRYCGSAAGTVFGRLRLGVDLGDLADEMPRQVDEMGALLVELPAGKRRISPPGDAIRRPDPVADEAEGGLALEQALRPADRAAIAVH